MKTRIFGVVCAVMVFIVAGMAVDYMRVFRFYEKPLAARLINTHDDGGSGLYQGIGYSFDIKGNFMANAEYPGVTWARFYVFGEKAAELER